MKQKKNKQKEFEYTLSETTEKDCEAFYKANEEYEIPEGLKELIRRLADK